MHTSSVRGTGVRCSAREAHAYADSNTAAGGRIGTYQMSSSSSFVANARHSARVRAPTNVRKSVCQEASLLGAARWTLKRRGALMLPENERNAGLVD